MKENFTINCGDTTSQHSLGRGLNSVLLPVGCEAISSELRILAPSVGTDDTGLEPMIHELDIIGVFLNIFLAFIGIVTVLFCA